MTPPGKWYVSPRSLTQLEDGRMRQVVIHELSPGHHGQRPLLRRHRLVVHQALAEDARVRQRGT